MPRTPTAANLDPNRVSATAILGGFTEPNASRDFRGGRLTAFQGGVSVDLRRAEIVDKPARIYMSPPSLAASRYRGPPTLDRQERASSPSPAESTNEGLQSLETTTLCPTPLPDLIVTGSALLGGILIRD